MRVTCQSFDEFMECLKSLGADESLYADSVRVSISYRDTQETSRIVTFQASAVVVRLDGGEYLLECGQTCGKDFLDRGGKHIGSEAAEEKKRQLAEYCGSKWKVLPGVIQI